MMRIIGGNPIENMGYLVGDVVPVCILQMKNSRFIYHQHATIIEFEPCGTDQVVVKDLALVGFPVAIGILENQQSVIGL